MSKIEDVRVVVRCDMHHCTAFDWPASEAHQEQIIACSFQDCDFVMVVRRRDDGTVWRNCGIPHSPATSTVPTSGVSDDAAVGILLQTQTPYPVSRRAVSGALLRDSRINRGLILASMALSVVALVMLWLTYGSNFASVANLFNASVPAEADTDGDGVIDAPAKVHKFEIPPELKGVCIVDRTNLWHLRDKKRGRCMYLFRGNGFLGLSMNEDTRWCTVGQPVESVYSAFYEVTGPDRNYDHVYHIGEDCIEWVPPEEEAEPPTPEPAKVVIPEFPPELKGVCIVSADLLQNVKGKKRGECAPLGYDVDDPWLLTTRPESETRWCVPGTPVSEQVPYLTERYGDLYFGTNCKKWVPPDEEDP